MDSDQVAEPGKRRKRQMDDEAYEAKRKELNKRRCARQKAKRAKRHEAKMAEEQTRFAGMPEEERMAIEAEEKHKRVQAHLQQEQVLADALVRGIRVIVDCSFITQCSDKEMRSLAKQLEVAVALNRRSPKPLCLTLTSFSGVLKAYTEERGACYWKAHRHSEGTLELFSPESVVVLSPDADEALLELQEGDVYVIGGIVDRSVQKNITLNFATERGCRARRLPVLENAEKLGLTWGTNRRPVLNVNDVFAALLEVHNSGDWVRALDVAIPHRKRRVNNNNSSNPLHKSSNGGCSKHSNSNEADTSPLQAAPHPSASTPTPAHPAAASGSTFPEPPGPAAAGGTATAEASSAGTSTAGGESSAPAPSNVAADLDTVTGADAPECPNHDSVQGVGASGSLEPSTAPKAQPSAPSPPEASSAAGVQAAPSGGNAADSPIDETQHALDAVSALEPSVAPDVGSPVATGRVPAPADLEATAVKEGNIRNLPLLQA